MRRSAARLLVGVAVLMAVACTFDQRVVAVPPSAVVVHAVLDPGDTLVDVLVERSLTGTITVGKLSYDPLDPINTGGGVPASGAQVSISGPDGTAQGFEIVYRRKPPTYGAGRYVFPRLVIRPGAKYTLFVRTTDGIVVTGSTVVPNFVRDPVASLRDPNFRRDLDTLSLSWKAVPNARTYGLRINSPFGAFQLFSDSTQLHIAGGLRNVFVSELPRVLIPGFEQDYAVYAADTNFFDYYRSRNDPFTGSGIINRLDGGIGLFGSTVTIYSWYVDVTQATTDSAFEGRYRMVQGSTEARSFIGEMRLYIETPASAKVAASVSGTYYQIFNTGSRDGIVGTRDANRIELDFLVNQDAQQRVATFVGQQADDSLYGTFTPSSGNGESVVFRKVATP